MAPAVVAGLACRASVRLACKAQPRAAQAVLPHPLRRAAASLGTAVAAAAVALSAAALVPPALAANLQLGAEVFEQNCAVCHAGGLNNIPGEEKHTLKRDALEKYLDGGLSVASIVNQVNQGEDEMPPFQGVLTPEEIEAVASYVYSQAVGDKW